MKRGGGGNRTRDGLPSAVCRLPLSRSPSGILGEILERTTGEPLHNYKVRDWLAHWLEMKEQVRYSSSRNLTICESGKRLRRQELNGDYPGPVL